MKRLFWLILAMIPCVVLFAGCSPKAEVRESTFHVDIGEEITIPVEFLTNGRYKITIESTDESKLIKVDENCFVALAEGTVGVQIKHANKVIDSCAVVIDIPIVQAEFINKTMSVDVGDKFKLPFTYLPENATRLEVEYKTDNPECLTILENGTFFAAAAGTANVFIYQDTRELAMCEVNISNVPTEAIAFEEKEIEVFIGRKAVIPVIFTPNNATFKEIEVTVSSNGRIEVENSGIPNLISFKGVSAGTVTLTAVSTEGHKASIRVKIVPVILESMSIRPSARELLVGGTGNVSYSLYPEDVTEQAVSFRSSNSQVLKVDQEGGLQAVGVGTATVTAVHNKSGIKETVEITVKPIEVTSVSISQSDFSLYPNETKQLKVIVKPSNATYPKVTWSTSNTDIATVSSTGVVTAKKAGTAVITAKTENGKSDTVRVTVKPTTKTFTVTITATCNGYNSVGNEWGKYFYVNNQQVSSGSRVSITMDRTTTIRTQIIEFDSINDVGTSTYSFNVPKNYFESGFYATQTVTVRENRGRYAGSVATWDIKYSFKPA